MTLSEELKWRGFVNQTTYKDISALDKEPITFYWGVDPSAKSMTVGNFALAMMVLHFIKAGHKPVLLVGGATGLIGDPDGKSKERQLKTNEEVQANVDGIAAQYKNLYRDFNIELVNNYDWFKDVGYIDFLREVGKHVPMRQMLGRDFVQQRLKEDGAGISYAEFSYSLIQGYDFLHLYQEKNVTLQVAGADQWGNSIAGVDLVRRIAGGEVNVWTAPLVVNKATGVKFGKSEEGAVWLDEKLTSVYRFYQFWLNVDDAGVEDYLKIYTLLGKDEIDALMQEFANNKAGRAAQKTLAYEVTKIVHGKERANRVKKISEVLFGNGDYFKLSDEDLQELGKELGVVEVSQQSDIFDILVHTNLASSKREARQFIQNGAVYLDGVKMMKETTGISLSPEANRAYSVLRRGKNSQTVIKLS